ncbi:methyl-accepting chemotaxis protein [Fictibacillus sp. 18YEL24]|uniref:methyl-accepting chemotaxis protein n=1 Tax=Fictibacillus sp. 18YEL24 TaxID=2745875 RepID=UPI0018CEE5EA|nr:methyl-accepting chemotaxis protein [Fictibacillus sp. 18YEL24]MBH0169855.1 methyl-accepting chemotaxis protein [Fictibacillus sp. 18YEL24]
MFKRIQTKIMLSVSILVAITLLSVSLFSYFQTKQQLVRNSNEQATSLSSEVKASTELYLKSYGDTIDRYSQDSRLINYLKTVKTNETKGLNEVWPIVDQDFKHFLDLNKNVAVLYIGAETKQFKTTPKLELPDGFDPTERPWYQTAKQTPEKIMWTEPYEDASSGEYVVTVTKPVLDPATDEVLGVVGLDLNLGGLTSMINKTKVSYKGYPVLFDPKGMALVHPTQQGKNLSKETFIKEIYKNEKGNVSYTYQSKDRELYYTTIDGTNWKLGFVYDQKELLKDAEELLNMILIFTSVAVIVALGVTYMLAKSISKPITRLQAQVQKVAEGDLTISVEAKSKDEVGTLTHHFNAMVENMRGLITSVSHSVVTVNESTSNLSAVSEETIAASEEVSRAVREIASGATTQAEDADETNRRTIDLSLQIEKVNEQAEEMTRLSLIAEAANKKGISQMDVLREKTGESNQVLKNIESVISGLAVKVEEIEQVIQSITEISNQTNLLALNASIEAARAGESGRGFAVVADEVRKLAEQSAVAADKVRKTISGIGEESERAVHEMAYTKKIAHDQNVTVTDTESAFNDISGTMADMVRSIEQITSEVEMINNYKEEVVASIQSIAAVAEQSAAASEEVSASSEEQVRALSTVSQSAEELNDASQALTEMIKHFKI